MLRLIGLLVVVAAAAYFTNPTADAHRTAANEVLRAQADEAANNFDLGGLIQSGAAALTQQGTYETFYVGSKYTVEAAGEPYIECWGAFTQVRCSRSAQASAS
ncbi:MAG: hypothetical protein NW206_14985 [Hyphomonadaceae bacterium]|nr:hypothetical protein [Hyphomonadaceae bacterium]